MQGSPIGGETGRWGTRWGHITLDSPTTTVIVDDGDASFFTAGGWTIYGSSGRGGDVRYVHNGAAPTTATWEFSGISAGTYRVSATWPGADASVRATELGSFTVAPQTLPSPAETLTYEFEEAAGGEPGGELLMEWATTLIRIPIEA